MGTSGNMITFVDEKELIYKDGTPIKKMNQMNFDNNGNVIFYDDDSKSILGPLRLMTEKLMQSRLRVSTEEQAENRASSWFKS